jgi:hypothetical protein
MDERWRRLLNLTDALVNYVQHKIPPEQLGLQELRELIAELKDSPTPKSALPRMDDEGRPASQLIASRKD